MEGNLNWVHDRMETLKATDPDKAFDLFMTILEYCKPKQSRQELKAPAGLEVTYTVKFK